MVDDDDDDDDEGNEGTGCEEFVVIDKDGEEERVLYCNCDKRCNARSSKSLDLLHNCKVAYIYIKKIGIILRLKLFSLRWK